MKLIFASYYDEVWIPIIKNFCERTNSQVCDWLVAYPSQDPSLVPEEIFKGAMIHYSANASKGLLASISDTNYPEIDVDVIAKMAPYEHMFMCMLDIYDPDGRQFSSRERREAYFDLLRFGQFILEQHQPDLYVAGTIPHSLHDYILYALCQVQRIPCLIYIPISLPGYLILQSSLEEPSSVLDEAYKKNLQKHVTGEVTLTPLVEKYYSKTRSDYQTAQPWYVKLRDHSLIKKKTWINYVPNPFARSNFFRIWLSNLKRGFGVIYKCLISQTYRYNYFEKPQNEFFKQKKHLWRDTCSTQFSTALVFYRGVAVKKALYRQYLKLQKQPDISVPYVLVLLHYQPEASTSPLGGMFVDQLLMVRLLAKYLPAGWKIYVKEHRTTFDPSLRGHFSRDAHYYNQLSSLPEVDIVSMEYSSFDLMDHAKAVATVTGTAGWEAVLRGIPSIVFGNAWYKSCEGVFDGSLATNCDEALRKINSGYQPDMTKVRIFMKTIEEIGVRADRDNSYILTEFSLEKSQALITDHLINEFKQLSTNSESSRMLC